MAKCGKMPLDEILATLNVIGSEENARRLRSGELKLVPRDPKTDLLVPVGEPIILPAVSRFVAKDAFTKENGIAGMGDNFKQFILPLVEDGVAAATLTVSDLTRAARDPRIYTALDVDEKGEVALAHFFQVLQDRITGIRIDGWSNAAYVIGNDGNTWDVFAFLHSDHWDVNAYQLGFCNQWSAGRRFLSR